MTRSKAANPYTLVQGGVPSQSAAPMRPWRTAILWTLGVVVVVAVISSVADSRVVQPGALRRVVPAVQREGEAEPEPVPPHNAHAFSAERIAALSAALPTEALSADAPAPAPEELPPQLAAYAETVIAAAPAPAPAEDFVPLIEAPPPGPPPAVAFLFLTINGEVVYPEVWSEFFAGAPDPARFNVYIHRSNVRSSGRAGHPRALTRPCAHVPPQGDAAEMTPAVKQFLAACRGRATFVETAPETAWGQLIAAERALAAGAVVAPENVAFAYVSHTTLPLKSFARVYEALIGRGNSSSFCVTTQQSWVRSRVDASVVFPKHSQWMVLSRAHAERFADLGRGDAVEAVNEACGGSWRQCYPATSEELVMAAITGPIPAVAMGSDWLASHPPARGQADEDIVTALRAEVDADVDGGAPANAAFEMPGVNSGALSVLDVGATNAGVCDTWHWWDDFGSDEKLEPAFEPFALLAKAVKARAGGDAAATVPQGTHDGDVEPILEQHVDRFWSPPYHPQELHERAMTEEFLLDGLCASSALFARKFAPSFTLRDKPLPRDADGEWTCPAAPDAEGADVWKRAARARIDGVSCDGMRHAPVARLGAHECRALCCAMGREQCTAWQYRGRWSLYHFCWVGHAENCTPYGEAQQQLWRGERLVEEPPAPAPDASVQARQRVIDAFARCFRGPADVPAVAADGASVVRADDAPANLADGTAEPGVPEPVLDGAANEEPPSAEASLVDAEAQPTLEALEARLPVAEGAMTSTMPEPDGHADAALEATTADNLP